MKQHSKSTASAGPGALRLKGVRRRPQRYLASLRPAAARLLRRAALRSGRSVDDIVGDAVNEYLQAQREAACVE